MPEIYPRVSWGLYIVITARQRWAVRIARVASFGLPRAYGARSRLTITPSASSRFRESKSYITGLRLVHTFRTVSFSSPVYALYPCLSRYTYTEVAPSNHQTVIAPFSRVQSRCFAFGRSAVPWPGLTSLKGCGRKKDVHLYYNSKHTSFFRLILYYNSWREDKIWLY